VVTEREKLRGVGEHGGVWEGWLFVSGRKEGKGVVMEREKLRGEGREGVKERWRFVVGRKEGVELGRDCGEGKAPLTFQSVV
jgi:hypothetical protein